LENTPQSPSTAFKDDGKAEQDQEAAVSWLYLCISIIYILLSFLRLDNRYSMIVLMDLKTEQIEKNLKTILSDGKVPGQNLAGQKFSG
jgi:hypothetical protein